MSLYNDFINVFYGDDDATNFNSQLLRLIAHADFENRQRLGEVFPDQVEIYEWYHSFDRQPDIKLVEKKVKEFDERDEQANPPTSV